MIDPVFQATIESLFSGVLDKYGLRKVSEIYTPESFGDSCAIFANEALQVRIMTDRGGPILVDIAPLCAQSNFDWYSINYVLEFLGKKRAEHLEDLPKLFNDHFDEIGDLFKPENYAHFKQRQKPFGMKKLYEKFPQARLNRCGKN